MARSWGAGQSGDTHTHTHTRTETGQTYGGVQVQQVDTVGAELVEAGLEAGGDLVGGVVAGAGGVVDFCGEGEAPLLPAGFAGEGLLLAADVDAGGVDLGVAALLVEVEDLCEVGDLGDAGAGGLVGAKGHEAQDDARGGGCSDERHGGR